MFPHLLKWNNGLLPAGRRLVCSSCAILSFTLRGGYQFHPFKFIDANSSLYALHKAVQNRILYEPWFIQYSSVAIPFSGSAKGWNDARISIIHWFLGA
jgi:hypothetical protein